VPARGDRRACSATSGIARSTVGTARAGLSASLPSRKRGAEHTLEGANPRFIVTSLKRTRIAYDARFLYEQLYCARGEAENRIGEQFELFADRASSATMQANQLRMSFSAMAYVLVDTLRRVGLRHSQFADAAVATIRLKLLKLGAQERTSVRRIHFAIASGCPNKDEFELAHIYLQRAFSSA
jgi:hypothetical protein